MCHKLFLILKFDLNFLNLAFRILNLTILATSIRIPNSKI